VCVTLWETGLEKLTVCLFSTQHFKLNKLKTSFALLGSLDPALSILEGVLSAGDGELARPVLSCLTSRKARRSIYW